MAFWKESARRLFYLLRRSRFEAELDEEMLFHVESRADELQAAGSSRHVALAQARSEFGRGVRTAEDTRDAWQFGWLEDLFSDLRYAARAFRRNPPFALTAIFCLALGIGANTTMFSITTSLLFSRPSCRDAASLAALRIGGNSHASMADYRFLRDAGIFEGLAGINVEREANWRNGEETSRLFVARVTSNLFPLIGIPLAAGRGIESGETNTVVLSDRFRRTRLGGVADVLGRTLVMDGQHYTVVGVLPSDHRTLVGFGFSPDVYLPVIHEDEVVQLYARLPRGMIRPVALGRLRSATAELDRVHPLERGWERAKEVTVTGVVGLDILGQDMLGPVLAFFVVLMMVVGLVLLIACANVASLLLARASARSHELAIRIAIGAGRMRIVRHLLAESLLLAVLGAGAGLALNITCGALLSRLRLPVPVPVQLVIAPDWRLLIYAICVALVSALAAGLLPAFRAVRHDVSAALKRDERQTGGGWNIRAVLVAGQVAVSIVLLATGFLFLRNLLKATAMNPGFDVNRTVWAYMRLVPENYTSQPKERTLIDTALDRLRGLPGVESAAIARAVPLNDNIVQEREVLTDLDRQNPHVRFQYNSVGPDYFRTMGILLVRGREFSAKDRTGPPEVILNETFARRRFGNLNPVGHTIRFEDGKPLIVIGVARNSKYFTIGESDRLALYEPYFDSTVVNLHFLIRTAGAPSLLVKPVNDTLGRLDRSAAIETRPMSAALGFALLPSRAGAALLGTFGVLGLALAAMGLYGVLLYSVSRRTREIGLRMALGAAPREVIRNVFGHSFALVGTGAAVGLAMAGFAMRPLAMFLVPGLRPTDPAALLAVVGVLAVVTLTATVAPALRALRVDPIVALRHE